MINLSEHLDELAKPITEGDHKSMTFFIMKHADDFGFYSGFIAGLFIDGIG